MKLINYDSSWKNKGYELPEYDRDKVRRSTKEQPTWIHFGAGNIFRGFPAAALQKLLNQGLYDKGVIVAEGFDYEIIDKAYRPFDDLSLLVVLKANGSIEKKVIGSVIESLTADSTNALEWNRLKEIFANPFLQMASFTITEKGYSLSAPKEGYLDIVETDLKLGPKQPVHIMGKMTALLYERYKAGAAPIAMVSMDNCSHNGDKLFTAIEAYAEYWVKNGFIEDSFLSYITDTNRVSFPWSMIDKITPRPDDKVKEMLLQDGFEDTDLIITGKNTYTAAFVNAEETEYLVIEDAFPNGRPPLEKAGILFTDRETVDKVEKMKVCTCLNPLHTALAIFGCLLSYQTIWEEMRDTDLVKLVNKIGYVEGMPVVVNPGVLNPQDFIKAVLELRLPNPFMPDAPQRIATDTSQKIPIRFGETIKAYHASNTLKTEDLTFIPLSIAGWCRYLMGVDDNGNAFTPSPDPLLSELRQKLGNVKLGEPLSKEVLRPILSNRTIFAVDLYQVGLGEKIEGMFTDMIAGKGAVRATLKKYLSE
ncbi:mannitol dehydrogenase family protein [Lachnospiraceae bacterium MD1]|jgi:fructuronate reductase|uniref:Mannitol dehydrogenase family protein n=1 Tax=Variimorphobacter saccharofermentans TaxID=2755051 RepID=A0A839K443_9FIRM|nr:mannitol dehydrogenase family protein [Variimorphobacter saccharofermentans]MBB2184380.1 mannitol dehydrogenase family protein [Variimorphobacter saccharofermentans]